MEARRMWHSRPRLWYGRCVEGTEDVTQPPSAVVWMVCRRDEPEAKLSELSCH